MTGTDLYQLQKMHRRRGSRTTTTSHGPGDVLVQVADSVKAVEHEAVEILKEAYEHRWTLHWSQLEEWQKDNEYIVRGYRR